GAFEVSSIIPSADATLANVPFAGGTTYTFQVRYMDGTAIRVGTMGTGDVRVTGPNGFNVLATFVGVDVNTDGTPRIATYRFIPPGGTWDLSDDGTYTVTVEPNQVTNTAGTAVPPVTLGAFRVVIPTTYIVTNASDSGPGSLRDALTRANTLPGTVDTILFDPVFFAAPRTITLTSGELPVTDSV